LIGFARLCPGDQYEVRRFNPTSWTRYCCYTLKGIVHTKMIHIYAPSYVSTLLFSSENECGWFDGALMVSQTDKKAP